MCEHLENDAVIIAADKVYVNGTLIYSVLFGFQDKQTGMRTLIPVKIVMYTVDQASVDINELVSEAFSMAHVMQYHAPHSCNG